MKNRIILVILVMGVLIAGVLCAADVSQVQFVGKTKYLNHARAVVSHSIDDSTKYVPNAVDAMDKYGIKATIFISTEAEPAPEDRFFTQLQVKDLWPRMRKAIADGHEIGSHSRQHPCKRPDTQEFCSAAYTDYEIIGSRDDILRETKQPHVWTWCYPCGNCANYDFIQKKIAAAGYLVARNYPNEAQDGHIRPDLQTWDANPMNAAYTQVVQKRGGAAKTQIIDVANLNAKFDEIYEKGGIYNFMSHPQWLDYGPDGFYERHLSHISRRKDVWYVPMGPLYAYRTLFDSTDVEKLAPGRFSITNKLDPKVYNGSLTLEFTAPSGISVKKLAERTDFIADRWDEEYWRREGDRIFVTVRPNTTVEFTPSAALDVWHFSYATPSGVKREGTFNLNMEGGHVTGTIVSERGTAKIDDGHMDGHNISFRLVRRGNGDEVEVRYEGKLENGVMKLKMHYGSHTPIAITATKSS